MAVPTWLVSGDEPRLTIIFADRRVEHPEVTTLPDFVTEQRNPGNYKDVMRIVVLVGNIENEPKIISTYAHSNLIFYCFFILKWYIKFVFY